MLGDWVKKCYNAIPNARRRIHFGELLTQFIFGKILLVVIHCAWIFCYPPNEDYQCWDQTHWSLLFFWPVSFFVISLIIQSIVYSIEQSQKMILFGLSTNTNFYISQTLHMSTRFLPECFSANFLSILFALVGIVFFFLETKQFFLLTRDI